MSNVSLSRIVALAVALSITAAVAPRRVQADTTPLLSQKLVWAHSMMCFPLELKLIVPYHPDTGYETYGANYPLDQGVDIAKNTGRGGLETDIDDAKKAGVDGFFVDIFTGNCEGYLQSADKVGGFLIAPCIDLSLVSKDKIEATAAEVIIRNSRIALKYKSSAMLGDRVVWFNYGTEMMQPDQWQRVFDKVAAAGCKIYFVGALQPNGDLSLNKQMPGTVAQWIPNFDAGYSFGATGKYWDDVIAAYKAAGKPFMGGMMPGYYRVGGGYSDPKGTATYRTEWHRHIDAKLPWTSISTWNDLAENTHLLPAADLNDTRSEITRWFSSKFKAEPLPWNAPRLYITTPKTMYPGKTYVAEALVLNGGAKAVDVKIELVDGNRKRLAGVEPVTATVQPGDDGSATATFTLPKRPANGFIRARAAVTVGGRTIESVTSAPGVWIDPIAQPGYPSMFYSIPAHLALPGKVGLKLAEGKDGTQTAVVTPPKANIKFVDLLHNTELARNFFANAPYEQVIPRKEKSGAIIGRTEWGYYVSRVIDQEHRVAYSDPIYIAPTMDLRVTETYPFDEGAGTSAKDTSAYKRIGNLRGVAWTAPGANGSGSCVSFDGKASRLDLPLSQGPVGPMAFSVSARPHGYGGMVYCDSGGMWLSFSESGHPQLVRLGPKGWATVEGKTKVPVDQWTQFRCVWDGANLKLFVNGQPDGETACASAFTSARRALGYNPFGGGSAYFNGDVDDFKIEMLD
ncbi:MAG TPA: LamG-like jellyroll fold domain-containing protein [Capsulimonadaceae bacterium]|jgi:hypothetical protein